MNSHHPITWCVGNLDFNLARQTVAQDPDWFLINCDMMSFGVWSGVRDLALTILKDFEQHRPDLIQCYDGTLYSILPEQRDRINPRHLNLTDLSIGDERVRSYPMDRAVRHVNGFVDIYEQWCGLMNIRPQLLLLHFDQASEMTRTFFKELVRRRGRSLGLRLIIHSTTANPDCTEFFRKLGISIDLQKLPHPALPAPEVDPQWARCRIADIFEIMRADISLAGSLYPEAIHLAKALGDHIHWMKGHQAALSYCNHYGYYHDALFHVKILRPYLEEFAAGDEIRYVRLLFSQVHAYLAIGRAHEILDLLDRTHQTTSDKGSLVSIQYMLAMFHIRFLAVKDDSRAVNLLQEAQRNLVESDFPDDRKLFLSVFIDNGLALVRMRQGRGAESIELCKRGFAQLAEGLPEDTHRLHRSVLLYNISQVYYALKEHEQAKRFLTLAIEMDPHYSEYFNERGNVHLQMGLHEMALADYHAAIERSGPYYEVYFNLGLCHKELGQYEQALSAFSKSLDLNPEQPAIYLSQSQIFEDQGEWEKALVNYNAYLESVEDPDQRVNRAVLLFQMGQAPAALLDLNRALECEPNNSTYYRNRAVALTELEHFEQAKADLEAYLRLVPDAEDRDEVLGEIQALCDRASLVS